MPNTHQCPWYADVQTKWKELGECAKGIIPARSPLDPRPSEIRAINDDLEVLARKVDALILAYGEYVKANSSSGVDLDLFTDQLSKALEGNATYEIECAASDRLEQIMEAAA
jgi:hypothetical protein